MSIEIGIASLSDRQPRTVDGRSVSEASRMRQIIELGVRADELGLDVFGVGEHHSRDFVVSSPAPVLAAVAARTSNIRLTSAVTVLSALDPVRVYQDFATLDLISGGRAEMTVGRSAHPEPFALFGIDIERYDEVFTEKLGLLLQLREQGEISWRGEFRPPLSRATVGPRADVPMWIGAGGTPASAARAGVLGLPLILGYLGGDPEHLRRLVDLYRAAGDRAGQSGLQVGVAAHYFGASSEEEAASTYPYYRDFLRPKQPGGGGYTVSPRDFVEGREPGRPLMIGTSEQVTEKLVELHKVVGFDRVQLLVDWGGLPGELVEASLERLGTEIAPAVRARA
ncbi:LLM class flavin-dependent oxidoreductase [Cryptosporangium phraense]|uniref:LLM class flavin-dependent oxidoreductase n=1 Tax=Cryptosporangium phraense TaxID=2593070 RepID=A0A545AJ50_9ACTN|nr:LLM class flavin-dependent oxidoreductase [Cryptosporangium phraense]TQS41352.1 LLM class flavin-dependent oxidoreductase [Cryptosporangium phraense]